MALTSCPRKATKGPDISSIAEVPFTSDFTAVMLNWEDCRDGTFMHYLACSRAFVDMAV